VLFNMLVGPVFSAGAVTSERERETLDLLLVTILSPWQILWGKLVSGLRVSSVLTSFLLWPLLLACVMVSYFWTNLLTIGGYLVIILLSCLTTAGLALFCSVIFRKTSVSMMTSYILVVVLFTAPVAVTLFAQAFYPDQQGTALVKQLSFTSPFSAAFALPLDLQMQDSKPIEADWPLWLSFVGFYVGLDLALALGMIWLFHTRWRVSH
jgi:ABC-type transport system involved in multi-copper enzyme maturation permease subunit